VRRIDGAARPGRYWDAVCALAEVLLEAGIVGGPQAHRILAAAMAERRSGHREQRCDRFEEPNVNTGAPWSAWEDQDLRWGLDNNALMEEIANFLCRTPSEIRQRIVEISEVDVIGDPSLLHDGLTHRDCIVLATYRDARAAMALSARPSRTALRRFGPERCLYKPGIHRGGGALMRGIYAIAEPARHLSGSSSTGAS
jgi:hypothetical protein